jgi:hypothetical protein
MPKPNNGSDILNNRELLETKMRREPFRPFSVELVSGTEISIKADSEILFPRNRPELVIVFSGNGLQHEFEETAIARLIDG